MTGCSRDKAGIFSLKWISRDISNDMTNHLTPVRAHCSVNAIMFYMISLHNRESGNVRKCGSYLYYMRHRGQKIQLKLLIIISKTIRNTWELREQKENYDISFSLCNFILSGWSRKKRIIVLKWCITKVKPCEKFRNVYVV